MLNSAINTVSEAVEDKMDKMTVDSAPTSGSSNLVTSGGVYTAINNKADASTVSSLQNTVNTINAYAIKSAGSSGQVWTSDGSGAGSWQTPVSGKKELYTGTLASLIATNMAGVTVNKEFDIEYILSSSSSTANRISVNRITVSAGFYGGSKNNYGLGECYTNGSAKCCIWINSSRDIVVEIGGSARSQITSTTVDTSGYRLYV